MARKKASTKKTTRKKRSASKSAVEDGAPSLAPTIEWVGLEQIDPAPYNPSRPIGPGDAGFERLRDAIEEFGCVHLLVWNKRSGHLVGGHQTLTVLQAINPQLEQVQCSVVDLPEDLEKALNLRLNRRATDDDPQRLGELLQEVIDADIDHALTGFDEDDINAQIAEMEKVIAAATPGSDAPAGENGDQMGATKQQDNSEKLASAYLVIAECDDEAHQKRVYELLREHKIPCKLNTVH